MTAAQNSIALKRSSWLGGLLAAAVVALIVAIIAIAISARPVAAPATVAVPKPYVQSLHDKHLNLAPTITGTSQGEMYVQSLLEKHYQAFAADEVRGQTYVQRFRGLNWNVQSVPPVPSYEDVTAPKSPFRDVIRGPRFGGPHRG